MQTRYEKILAEQGKEAASDYMRAMRAKVKTPGLANLSQEQRREVARKVWVTRRAKENTKSQSQTKRLGSV